MEAMLSQFDDGGPAASTDKPWREAPEEYSGGFDRSTGAIEIDAEDSRHPLRVAQCGPPEFIRVRVVERSENHCHKGNTAPALSTRALQLSSARVRTIMSEKLLRWFIESGHSEPNRFEIPERYERLGFESSPCG